jgi:hypothetical protein
MNQTGHDQPDCFVCQKHRGLLGVPGGPIYQDELVYAGHVYAFVLGDHVPHLHVHLVPRYPGAPAEYWGVHVDEWPGAPRGGPAEVQALVSRLRNYLPGLG